ncbi:MAG: 4-hydroxythreonine-4-phosphate dehydrogenase PdxA [Candidatus Methylomirabilales bacterium]
MRRVRIGITIGDPAGIGPEIVLKALTAGLSPRILPFVIGDARILERAQGSVGMGPRIQRIGSAAEARGESGRVEVLDLANADPARCPVGCLSPEAGRAAVEAVFRAADLAMAGEIDAMVTAPLHKEAMDQAGFPYRGHTELLAERTATQDYAMLLMVKPLRVVHVSTHVALREACALVTRERVLTVIRLAKGAAKALKIPGARIGVAGLNPHAGEHGLFGTEEATYIRPAIVAAQGEGINVEGPISPDTLFTRALRGEFDFIIAMYHDQGHVPLKLIGFDRGVNVTLGLPIIRTSVDHGTAFDIAGKGIASARSLIEAIRLAARLAVNAPRGKGGQRAKGSAAS